MSEPQDRGHRCRRCSTARGCPMSVIEAQQVERRTAVRALLRQPLLTASSGDLLAVVRRHAAWLREFFADSFGWSLHVERELARLGKTPGDPFAGNRAARPVDAPPFSKRRYVVLCL